MNTPKKPRPQSRLRHPKTMLALSLSLFALSLFLAIDRIDLPPSLQENAVIKRAYDWRDGVAWSAITVKENYERNMGAPPEKSPGAGYGTKDREEMDSLVTQGEEGLK